MNAERPRPSDWNPAPADLVIATLMAALFPFVAGKLLDATGALLPMLLYYGAAWTLARFRRGTTGYYLEVPPGPPVWFWINLALIGAGLAFGYLGGHDAASGATLGILVTAVVWAPANASSEQLLWLYIFDSWDLYGARRFGKAGRVAMRVAGLLLFTVFVGTIHTFYWARFLTTAKVGSIFGTLFVVATSLSGYLHILVWRKSGRMVYTFIPHLILNLAPLAWTGYSMLPYLVKN